MRLDQAEPEKGSLVLATAPFTQHRAGPGPSHFTSILRQPTRSMPMARRSTGSDGKGIQPATRSGVSLWPLQELAQGEKPRKTVDAVTRRRDVLGNDRSAMKVASNVNPAKDKGADTYRR